jgi:putative transposase
LPIAAGVTYVFDKGYCHFDGGQVSITQRLSSSPGRGQHALEDARKRPPEDRRGDGFTIKADREVKLASKGDSKLPIFLRRITITRDSGDTFDIISNDRQRSALELAACYKARWQIELFFKWIKQNLNIKKFIAFNENAVRLQILAAMIAFVLIHLARKLTGTKHSPRRFAELVAAFIHTRRNIARLDKPPPINPSRPNPKSSPDQLTFAYA